MRALKTAAKRHGGTVEDLPAAGLVRVLLPADVVVANRYLDKAPCYYTGRERILRRAAAIRELTKEIVERFE